MQERPGEERRRIELNGTQVAASALAAVSSAFLLSSLGAAGTMIGAAIASVCATVGSAVYVHMFRRTGDQLRDVRAQMTTHPRQPAVPAPPGSEDATRVMPVFDPGRGVAAEPLPALPGTAASGGSRDGERPRNRTWLVRSVVGAVAVFAIAMAAITVTELGMGKSFASLFGNGGDRPTISEIGGGGGHKSTPDKQPTAPTTTDTGTGGSAGDHAPTPGATGGTGGSDGKQSDGGGAGTSPTATPTPTATEKPTPTPTEAPTDKPTTPPTGGAGTGGATPPAQGGQDQQVPPAGDAAKVP
ncbi:MAG: hypothetical protein HOV66_26165 [Streptomycetaceae bacterium]|nr:hypothetical protein [Streptomycetaceae bacterium]